MAARRTRGSRGRGRELGMTLVEMLVVLAIVGVAAGAAVLGLGASDRRASVETEARRLAARIRVAADDSMVTDAMIAFAADDRGYGFVARDPATGAWQVREDGVLARHALPAGIELEAAELRGPVPIAVDGAARAIDVQLRQGGQVWTVRWDGLEATAEAARS
jgi:general secretion pathway protein H